MCVAPDTAVVSLRIPFPGPRDELFDGSEYQREGCPEFVRDVGKETGFEFIQLTPFLGFKSCAGEFLFLSAGFFLKPGVCDQLPCLCAQNHQEALVVPREWAPPFFVRHHKHADETRLVDDRHTENRADVRPFLFVGLEPRIGGEILDEQGCPVVDNRAGDMSPDVVALME